MIDMGKRAVFLDRDGTINVDIVYLSDPTKLALYPGVAEGIRLLNDAGFKVIVITNQSGIARGLFDEYALKKIHEKLCAELATRHARIDAIYYCPHHPDANCSCRKPGTMLFELAISEHDIDPKKSFVIGDRMMDIEAGHRIGARTILVPEKGKEKSVELEEQKSAVRPDAKFTDFYSAVQWILQITDEQK